MSATEYAGGVLRKQWDDATRTFTEYNALEAADPDVVLVIGSVNDGASTASVVEQAASDYYAALDPRPVIVVGVEPLFDAGDPMGRPLTHLMTGIEGGPEWV